MKEKIIFILFLFLAFAPISEICFSLPSAPKGVLYVERIIVHKDSLGASGGIYTFIYLWENKVVVEPVRIDYGKTIIVVDAPLSGRSWLIVGGDKNYSTRTVSEIHIRKIGDLEFF